MRSTDFRELERGLYRNGSREFEGVAKFADGTKLPYEQCKDMFVKTAFDLWSIEPNVAITESFWKLDDDKKFFIKVYDTGEPTPHDHRWSVFADDDKSKVSVAYKNDPLVSIDIKTLGFGAENIVSAQKSLLKLLSTKDGVSSLLGSVDDNIRSSFLGRYPELGV